MNREELERLIAEEVEASERTRDEPLSEGAVRKRQTQSVVYSIRLTPEQTEEIQRIADSAGVPAAGIVRGWVLQGLAAERDGSVEQTMEALSRDLERLRRQLTARRAS
jgi:predicted DNA-binding protein